MESNALHKRQVVTQTPLLLFDCELTDGRVERWATHRISWDGANYEERVVQCGQFSLGIWALEGSAGNSKLSIVLANTDAYGTQIEQTCGWKHAKLTVRVCFADLSTGEVVTSPEAVFSGVANPPEELTEASLRLGFNNRLNLEKLGLPTVRVQPRCPWAFPETSEQRLEAVDGGGRGKYSPFYACGYSADQPLGRGNLNGDAAFTRCNRSKSDCQQRGMFSRDAGGRETARFGGFQFLPPTIQVRAHGEKQSTLAESQAGKCRTGDPVPLLYGNGWIQPPAIFSRSDGNFQHYELLLGSGPIQGIRRVLVEGNEIPEGIAGQDYGATGWWSLISRGERNGAFNGAFRDGLGEDLGDPHGSIAILGLALPKKVYASTSPKIQVLCDGMRLPRPSADGSGATEEPSGNPALVVLDLLYRCGWKPSEIDLTSIVETAEALDELIEGTDSNGQPVYVPRALVGLAVTAARSASELLRGIQANAGCYLSLGSDGRLVLRPEGTIAEVHPTKRAGSNAGALLAGGWPAYEFGDGMDGSDGILLDPRGQARLRMWSRPTSQCPNRYQIEFQDSLLDYRQSGMVLTDIAEVGKTAQEISTDHPALGITSIVHASRALTLALHKSLRGNCYLEIESSVQAIGLRPGDLVSVSYSRWGLDRTLFRVLSVEPSQNFEQVRITAQKHLDAWYAGGTGETPRDSSNEGWISRLPRPLAGSHLTESGEEAFRTSERVRLNSDNTASIELGVEFTAPRRTIGGKAGIPLVGSGEVESLSGGALKGGRWYYGFSSVDEHGSESGLSMVQPVTLPDGTLEGKVRFGSIRNRGTASSIRAYRGRSPQQLRLVGDIPASVSDFLDDGTSWSVIPAPDPAFFEARFYWRHELVPETKVDAVAGRTIQAAGVAGEANVYAGRVIRILKGSGAGQENRIESSGVGNLTVANSWVISPDSTSTFAISEANWRPGGTSRDEAAFVELPNRPGATVHLTGVSANAAGDESDMSLAPLTRVRLVGDTSTSADTDVPGIPNFAVSAGERGRLRLSNLGLDSLVNTRSIHSGTLRAHFVDELSPEFSQLRSGCDAAGEILQLDDADWLQAGARFLLDGEILQIVEMLGSNQVEVRRGTLESAPDSHVTGTPAIRMQQETLAFPLSGEMFGSPAAANFVAEWPFHSRLLVAAEFYLSNQLGDGAPARTAYTALLEGGLRFPEGETVSVQYSGVLARTTSMAPPVSIPIDRSIQAVDAVVGTAPAGGDVQLLVKAGDREIADIRIENGFTRGEVTMLGGYPMLASDDLVSVEIREVPSAVGSWPGSDLTVMVRL